VKIAFIYRGDPRHRTANRVSIFHNLAAATRLGHEVVLVIPRAGMSAARARQEVDQACVDFGISERLAVKTIPRPALKQRFRRSFDFLAACWVRAGNFDLVWSREFHAADYATAFGLKAILEHHHPFTDRQWKVARRMLGRESFKGVAAISGVHQQMLLSEGWPKEKVIVAHSGVDFPRFSTSGSAQDLRRGNSDQQIALYAGSFFPGKGCDQILAAASHLPQVKFVCVGGRDREVAEFKRQVASLGLTNIEFIGHVPHARIPAYLQAADILVAPFTEDGRDIAGKIIIPFSSPLKLFEYMAMGKPIIASNIGAIPEIIVHEENGLLVEPGDVDALTEATLRLVRDVALARRLGATAQKDARQYSWTNRAARVIEFAVGHDLNVADRISMGVDLKRETCG